MCNFCCNFDLLPHEWGPLRKYGRVLRGIRRFFGFFAKRDEPCYIPPADVFRMQASKAIDRRNIIE